MTTIRLNQAHCPEIAASIPVPSYDRRALKPRIVHIGLGHFHRAHQAAYVDELLSRGLGDSGIFAVNLVEDSYPLADIAREQDYLYTLAARSGGGEETVRVVGSIIGYLNARQDPEKVIARLASEETGIISLTITEKGYYYDAAAGEPDWNAGPLQRDMAQPGNPETAAGFLAAALERRRRTGGGPLTIMSCDNVPSNGNILKTCVRSFAQKAYPGLDAWIRDNVSFPLSMVDRITPAAVPALVRHIEDSCGVSDRWPVCCEDFRQWVLEDNFLLPEGSFNPRTLAAAGVQLVTEVEPYELMKIRLLNGSHSALAYPAYLMGYRDVAEAVEDPLIGRFIRRRYMEEITTTLSPVEGIDLEAYKDTLMSRFANRNVGDKVLRLASDGSRKIPISILMPLGETARRGYPHGAIVFALAAWARFLEGSGENGEAIPLEDPQGLSLSGAAKRAREDPSAFLRAAGFRGAGEEFGRMAGELGTHLREIHRRGMKKALEDFLVPIDKSRQPE
jgi:mannitol 2-dehydrogenase